MGKSMNWARAKKRSKAMPRASRFLEEQHRRTDTAARWLERHDPMIDRQGNKILIECDSCDEVYTGQEGDDWSTTWAAANEEGWRTKKIADVWVHGCPRCGV
jgi:hypothetical protein